MKRLKNISLFKITILITINLLIDNWLVLVLSIIYLIIDNYKSLFVFILIFLLLVITNNKNDFLNIGIVDEFNNKYVIVDKIFYKVKLFDTQYEIGDVVLFNSPSSINENINDRKYNILYTNLGNSTYLTTIITRNYISNIINNIENNETSDYFKKILLNDYVLDSDIDYLGYGFSFYYLLLFCLKRDRRITSILLILYILFFGFQAKFYLLFIDILLYRYKLDIKNKLSFKILFILLINKYLLLSYSILISLLFTLIFSSEFNAKSYIFALQSILFNQIQPLNCYFYRLFIKIRIIIFIFTLISFFITPIQPLYTCIISLYIKIIKLSTITLRGKINLVVYLFMLYLFKKLKIKNDLIKCIVICLFIVSPLQNPFLHVNFINVGQGDATLIHGLFNTYNILIDTASKYNYSKLKKSLYQEGIYSIDYLIITHNDEDHSGNIDNLKNDFKIKEIITEGKDIKKGEIKLDYLDLGIRNEDNDSSLVYLLNVDNYRILFTGDISNNVENIIINKYGIHDIDILKVAHHGSKYSTSSYFVSSLLPKIAIISTSGLYGHPSQEVIDILDSYLVKTYITKYSGNIKIYYTKLLDILKTDHNECYIIN